jgi:hypothetical protein
MNGATTIWEEKANRLGNYYAVVFMDFSIQNGVRTEILFSEGQ